MIVHVGRKYKHFKGGIYVVDCVATHSENLDKMVIYHKPGHEEFWARPMTMFTGLKKVEGKLIKRFTLIEEEN